MEASEKKDRFYYMSPVERNNYLRSLFNTIPTKDVSDDRYQARIDESFKLYEIESEALYDYIKKLLRKFPTGEYIDQSVTNFRHLLHYASITNPFKDHISLFFRNMLIAGSDRNEIVSFVNSESSILLDTNFPQSPGIFDVNIARDIEHSRFKQVSKDIALRGSVEIARLPQWRIAYWRKYKVDPRIDTYKAERPIIV